MNELLHLKGWFGVSSFILEHNQVYFWQQQHFQAILTDGVHKKKLLATVRSDPKEEDNVTGSSLKLKDWLDALEEQSILDQTWIKLNRCKSVHKHNVLLNLTCVFCDFTKARTGGWLLPRIWKFCNNLNETKTQGIYYFGILSDPV